MTGISRTCLVSHGTNGGISMDSHLSPAVYTYDCMHKYACKELHTYTTLRVHIYIQKTTHMPVGTNYTREPCVQYIFKYSQTCTALRAQFHIQISYTKNYLHYIKCSARRLQAAPCLPMSYLSINILYTLSVRGTLRHVDVCIGSPQYDVLGAHKTNPNRRQYLFRGA